MPFKKHYVCHFYYNDVAVDCLDEYKDFWDIYDNYWFVNVYYRDAFISSLKLLIENRFNKLKELYFKVNNKETINEVDDGVKYILSNNILIQPKLQSEELNKISNKLIPPECKISKDEPFSIEPKHLTTNDFVELLYTPTQDDDLDKLIEKIADVLKQIPIRNDLSEETYKIKSIPKNINNIVAAYLNIKSENRKNKKSEVKQSLEYMLKTVMEYSKMVENFIEMELNTQIKFIEYKYK